MSIGPKVSNALGGKPLQVTESAEDVGVLLLDGDKVAEPPVTVDNGDWCWPWYGRRRSNI